MIYAIVNMILDYLKKTMHNLLSITANIQGDVLWKKSSETLNKILGKYPRKIPFFW